MGINFDKRILDHNCTGMGIRRIFTNLWEELGFLEGLNAKNKEFSNYREFPSEKEALMAFERSKAKLFDVNRWSELPGINSAFHLHDTEGEKLNVGKPPKGSYIYIDLPGPDPENWVQVIDILDKQDVAEFTVRPCAEPRALGEEQKEIKHFFTDKATSTFRVKRIGKTIFAYEIGKQEEINNRGEKAGNRKIINTIIAETGSIGLQKMQWDKLTNYLVHNSEIE